MAKGDYKGLRQHNVEHKCVICGDLFMGRPNKKYCSPECRHKNSNAINVKHYHADPEWREKRKANTANFIKNNPNYIKEWLKDKPTYNRDRQRAYQVRKKIEALRNEAV